MREVIVVLPGVVDLVWSLALQVIGLRRLLGIETKLALTVSLDQFGRGRAAAGLVGALKGQCFSKTLRRVLHGWKDVLLDDLKNLVVAVHRGGRDND
jgi:hypothetical protein